MNLDVLQWLAVKFGTVYICLYNTVYLHLALCIGGYG